MARSIDGARARRSSTPWRAALALLGSFAGSFVLQACLIEERVFDESRARCDDFCAKVMENCTAENAVYSSVESCTAVCSWLSTRESPEASGSGNTLSCRIDILNKVGLDFEGSTDCPALGPGGHGICGSDCESYCSLQETACGPIDQARRDLCTHGCPGLANPDRFNAETGLDKDNLQCRLAHLAEALVSDQAGNCRQAEVRPPEGGDSDCWDEANTTSHEDNCRTYCGVVMQACSDENAVYASPEQCERVCSAFEDGDPIEHDVNTVRCRRYHAYSALADPRQHCTHAGPSGDGHCGDENGNCESYCTLLKAGCSQRFNSEYAGDVAACTRSCMGAPGADPRYSDSEPEGFSDYDGRGRRYSPLVEPTAADAAVAPLQCRVYYAIQAVDAATDSGIDPGICDNAFADPGTPCQ
jgi:hypothetical protein